MLWYISVTIPHRLLLEPAYSMHKLSLRSYSDSDWKSELDDKCSILGSCVFLWPNVVAWIFKKQSLVAQSITEVKYHTLTHTTTKVLWIESLLQELSVPHLPPKHLCDNLNVVMIYHNSIFHARTKHIELNIHFVRERVATRKLQTKHVPAQAHIAYILTKRLPSNLFVYFQNKLKISCLKQSWVWGRMLEYT